MNRPDIRDLISRAEYSTIQLKQNITNPEKLAAELVAFANTKGGYILIGVANDKTITGLSDADIDRLNQLISNVSEQHVRPPLAPLAEVYRIGDKKIMLLQIEEGVSKPYATKEGVYWIKKAADKRKISQDELLRLFQRSYRLYADEQLIAGSSESDIDQLYFADAYEQIFQEPITETGLDRNQLLKNLRLSNGKELTLAGLLLFAKKPQRFKPGFQVKAVSWFGNEPEGLDYRDSEDLDGYIGRQFRDGLGFLLRNLHKRQNGRGFNTEGEPEIPRLVLEEVLVNALIHRNYYINAPVRLFVFDDRVEIISPGSLPNSLSVENILSGVSVIRNPILTSFASKLIPYRGVGTGVRRAAKLYPEIRFINNPDAEQFTVIMPRKPV